MTDIDTVAQAIAKELDRQHVDLAAVHINYEVCRALAQSAITAMDNSVEDPGF
jgi:hypothetical protein